MDKREALKAMESIAEFISFALEITKREDPGSYNEEAYNDLAEKCATVLAYLKQEE